MGGQVHQAHQNFHSFVLLRFKSFFYGTDFTYCTHFLLNSWNRDPAVMSQINFALNSRFSDREVRKNQTFEIADVWKKGCGNRIWQNAVKLHSRLASISWHYFTVFAILTQPTIWSKEKQQSHPIAFLNYGSYAYRKGLVVSFSLLSHSDS